MIQKYLYRIIIENKRYKTNDASGLPSDFLGRTAKQKMTRKYIPKLQKIKITFVILAVNQNLT